MTDRRLAVESWESLFRAQHEIFDEISVDFDDADLMQSEYDVLLTVTRAPDMTARLRDVTALMLVSQPSVSRLVDRMVARGLVTKRVDPDDGRGALVQATELGAEAFRAIARRHICWSTSCRFTSLRCRRVSTIAPTIATSRIRPAAWNR